MKPTISDYHQTKSEKPTSENQRKICLVPEIYTIPVLVVDLSDHNHFIKKDTAFEKIP